MGYKTKSMINQRGPGQLPGFDIGNLNSLQEIIKKESSKSSSATKAGPSRAMNAFNLLQENLKKENSKVSSPTKANKKLIEGGKFKRSERKEVRDAGKEAVKNTELKFKKATLMGGDYFSLMAATAENLANRGIAKRKVKKAAKDLKREKLSESKDIKPIESKGKTVLPTSKETTLTGEQIMFRKVDETMAKEQKRKLAAGEKANDDAERLKRGNEALFEKVDKNMAEYNKQKKSTTPTGEEIMFRKINKTMAEGRNPVNKNDSEIPKSKKNNVSGETSNNINEIQRAYIIQGMPEKAREVGEDYNKQQIAEDNERTGTKIPFSVPKSEASKFDANLIQGREKAARERELQKQESLKKAKEITSGLQMTGDGFNKGMSRKNKYKK